MGYEWNTLQAGPFRRQASMPGVDPMWVWADATGYRDLGLSDSDLADGLWCIEERDSRIISSLRQAADTDIAAAAELAMPVRPQRMPARNQAQGRFDEGDIAKSAEGKALIGIIDSGCPFAARMIRDSSGENTRVLGVWDQDDAPAFAKHGFRPAICRYGRAITREGLNALMQQARLPSGQIDEDRCYRRAGCAHLRSRLSHGAAVMSQLFAAPLHGGALQRSPGARPPWDASTAAIDEADLVFVDLPRAAVQDSTSGGLARYVIDGLRFILAHAVPKQRVVVVISNGTSRGTHDGKSLLERALVAAVEKTEIELHIVLPVGNGNMEQRHAVLSRNASHLTLFLPPGCEMPQYVHVHWPPGQDAAYLRITPPSGPEVAVRRGEAKGLFATADTPCCGVVSPPPEPAQAARSLLAFGPTASYDPRTPRPPSGHWKIELVADGDLTEAVQFWISRNQRNQGALMRGRQAYFVDSDRRHHPDAWLRYTEDDPFITPGDGIRRTGAVTGLATAALKSDRIHVVGSMYVSGIANTPSPYSAAGSGLPQWSAPGDTSRALQGLSVHGNHAGEIVRVLGTSFAAPLVARGIVNRVLTEIPRGGSNARHVGGKPRVGANRLTPHAIDSSNATAVARPTTNEG